MAHTGLWEGGLLALGCGVELPCLLGAAGTGPRECKDTCGARGHGWCKAARHECQAPGWRKALKPQAA